MQHFILIAYLYCKNNLIMRKYFVFIFALMLTGIAQAQDPHFSQFFASPLTLNPAFTGKFDGQWRLAANHRDQWPSIPKAYVTTSASLDFPVSLVATVECIKNWTPEVISSNITMRYSFGCISFFIYQHYTKRA